MKCCPTPNPFDQESTNAGTWGSYTSHENHHSYTDDHHNQWTGSYISHSAADPYSRTPVRRHGRSPVTPRHNGHPVPPSPMDSSPTYSYSPGAPASETHYQDYQPWHRQEQRIGWENAVTPRRGIYSSSRSRGWDEYSSPRQEASSVDDRKRRDENYGATIDRPYSKATSEMPPNINAPTVKEVTPTYTPLRHSDARPPSFDVDDRRVGCRAGWSDVPEFPPVPPPRVIRERVGRSDLHWGGGDGSRTVDGHDEPRQPPFRPHRSYPSSPQWDHEGGGDARTWSSPHSDPADSTVSSWQYHGPPEGWNVWPSHPPPPHSYGAWNPHPPPPPSSAMGYCPPPPPHYPYAPPRLDGEAEDANVCYHSSAPGATAPVPTIRNTGRTSAPAPAEDHTWYYDRVYGPQKRRPAASGEGGGAAPRQFATPPMSREERYPPLQAFRGDHQHDDCGEGGPGPVGANGREPVIIRRKSQWKNFPEVRCRLTLNNLCSLISV